MWRVFVACARRRYPGSSDRLVAPDRHYIPVCIRHGTTLIPTAVENGSIVATSIAAILVMLLGQRCGLYF